MLIGPVFFADEASFPRKNVTPCPDTGRESSFERWRTAISLRGGNLW